MNGDLMPLVDELHALRNENASLRAQIADQSVRIDEMLQEQPTIKNSLRYMTVAVEHLEVLMNAGERLPPLLAKKLAHLLVTEAPRIAQRVESADKDTLYYRFAFISLGGVK